MKRRRRTPTGSDGVLAPRGIPPSILREAGILRDPDKPEQAYLRATGLIRQGCFQDAVRLLRPHLHCRPAMLQATIRELRAICALHLGGDAGAQLDDALAGQRACGHTLGEARVLRHLGMYHLATGRFRAADESLSRARSAYASLDRNGDALWAEALRALVRFESGDVHRARARLDRCLSDSSAQGRPLALMWLYQARILAGAGDSKKALSSLLRAERALRSCGSRSEWWLGRIVRAEILIRTGQSDRARMLLHTLLTEVVGLEDLPPRAWTCLLLGESYMAQDSNMARRFLSRANHLYEKVGHTYAAARSDLLLAQAESRMGLNAQGRLAASWERLRAEKEWQLLRAEHRVVAAQVADTGSLLQHRDGITRARQYALAHGNRALARVATSVLHERFGDQPGTDMLTPVILGDDTQGQSISVTFTKAKGGRLLQPIDTESKGAGIGSSRLVITPRRALILPTLPAEPSLSVLT